MILVDTSVWIGHLRAGNSILAEALEKSLVLIHPFVAGEIACGNLKNRSRILADFRALPPAVSATHAEVLEFVEERRLWKSGVGWMDAHLLASALLSHCSLWTLDRQLNRAAARAGVNLYKSWHGR